MVCELKLYDQTGSSVTVLDTCSLREREEKKLKKTRPSYVWKKYGERRATKVSKQCKSTVWGNSHEFFLMAQNINLGHKSMSRRSMAHPVRWGFNHGESVGELIAVQVVCLDYF